MAMVGSLTASEEAQLQQTIEMFEVITQSQPQDYQSLEILKEAYHKLGRENDVVDASKRIAQAYVMMGQLSSAILEYESILQRCPEDADVLAALGEIENKANTINAQSDAVEIADATRHFTKSPRAKSSGLQAKLCDIDDGRQTMYKIFVESRVIAQGDFELCWVQQDLTKTPEKIVEPFVQLLMDKGILPLEKALKIVSDKHRSAFLPLERYDIDVELARSFPSEILQRWCVLPFDRMSKSVLIATCNPFNKRVSAELEEATKQRFLWYLASPLDLMRALRKVVR
jgi:tetratricopeptide (TPR) repeat protein